ncbi:MAG: hypothetical protein ACLGHO_00050 [Gammaproteobacteria bacterium]
MLTLLLMQGLRVHVHTFTDHEALHGHDHAVELHVGGMPTDSGHDPDDEIGLAKPAILKIKTAHADSVVLPIVAVLLLVTLAVTGRVPWRPGRFFHPAPGGHVRTPPLRAPPV